MLVRRKRDRGQSVVEFAMVLPILLLVVFGITEFGRAFATKNVLTHAAREGVRVAALGGTDGEVTTRVMEVLDAANVAPAVDGITVVGPDPMDFQKKVTVSVSSDFEVLSGSVLPFSGTISLSGSSVMRFEG